MFINNRLLQIAFKKSGYDSTFLSNVRKNYYGGFLKDEFKLVDVLYSKYRNTGKLLVIVPDFDVDGISSGLTYFSGLSLLGINVAVYVPDSTLGYGFHVSDVDKILALYPDLEGIITCDVGITAVEASKYFKSLCPGKDLFITDHHNDARVIHEDGTSEHVSDYADVVVDPCRIDENYEFTSVCGAFVTYHVVMNLAKKIGDNSFIDLVQRLSIFTMLGSLGDTMLMQHDTLNISQEGIRNYRTLISCVDGDFDKFYNSGSIKHDVDNLPLNYRLPFEGLYCMYLYLFSNQTVTKDTIIDFKFMSFTIIPMLNTPKRLEKSMQIIYDCFCVDYSTFSSYHKLFSELYQMNIDRKNMVSKVMTKIDNFRCAESPFMFDITSLNIPGGSYGLIATKLLMQGMPFVFVGSRVNGSFSGSGRVCSALDGNVINTAHITINGHSNAFGFDLKYEHMLDYTTHLDQVCKRFINDMCAIKHADDYDPYAGVVHVGFDVNRISDFDYVFTEKSVDESYDYAYDIMQLDCFSKGFDKPKFVLDFADDDVSEIRIIGTKGTTLSIKFKTGLKLIMFNGKSYYEAYTQGMVKPLIGSFDINIFRGSYSVQFMADGVY